MNVLVGFARQHLGWLSRCPARRERRQGEAYFGRCDARRGHDGLHYLERGFDSVRWSTDEWNQPYPSDQPFSEPTRDYAWCRPCGGNGHTVDGACSTCGTSGTVIVDVPDPQT